MTHRWKGWDVARRSVFPLLPVSTAHRFWSCVFFFFAFFFFLIDKRAQSGLGDGFNAFQKAEELGALYDGICPAGDAVVYDYRLMHRGMCNTSVDVQRPLLQFLYHIPSYTETKNYGTTKLLA